MSIAILLHFFLVMKLVFWVCQYINFYTIIKLINSTMHSENLKTVSCKEEKLYLDEMGDNLHVIMRHMTLTVVKELKSKK